MSDKPYSKREQDNFMTEIFKRMDSQDKVLERIEIQTTKTNGRVNGLENFRFWIIGVGVTFLLLGSTVFYLLIQSIDYKITKGIDVAFDTRFANEIVK